MNESQHMVRDFHIATNNPTPNYPTLKFYRPELRVKLLREETQEFADAVQNHYDFMKKQLPVDGTGAERLELLSEMADALCDILYVAYGAAVELGLDLEPLFDEVHKTNMRKAGAPEDASGKQMKPTGWRPPALKSLIQMQLQAYNNRPEWLDCGGAKAKD